MCRVRVPCDVRERLLRDAEEMELVLAVEETTDVRRPQIERQRVPLCELLRVGSQRLLEALPDELRRVIVAHDPGHGLRDAADRGERRRERRPCVVGDRLGGAL